VSEDADPVELFKKLTDAIVAADLDRASELLAEDVVLDWSRSRGPLQDVYRGHAGARSYWQQMFEVWDMVHWRTAIVARPTPDTVVLESTPRGRGKGSGIEMGGRGGLIVRADADKIVEVTLFQSPEEAMEAVSASD
jgi:ketosteroid isomerase-like protein